MSDTTEAAGGPGATPAVSVILPTHNRARLLMRALASVLGQTFRDIEVIVIENGCTDDTSNCLDQILDSRMRRLKLEDKSGASVARNAGLKMARASMVAFQDDDDVWLPEKLACQVDALNSSPPETTLCICGYLRLTPGGVISRVDRRYFDELSFFHTGLGVRDYSVIATPGWLVHRRHLDVVGHFDERLPARNDWELALRLRDLGPFTYVESPLYLQDQRHETSMMKNESAFGIAVRCIEAKHGHRWANDRRVRARHAEIIGRAEISQGNIAEGRAWLRQSIRLSPAQPRLLGLFVASMFGKRWLAAIRGLRNRGFRSLRFWR